MAQETCPYCKETIEIDYGKIVPCPKCGGLLKVYDDAHPFSPWPSKYCKVCFENKDKKIWMENLGDRIKCPGCGREVPISGGEPLTRSLRSADPVRFRTGGGGFGVGGARGSGRDRLDTWETPASIRRSGRRMPRQSVGRFPLEPDFDIFHNQKDYRISITLPYHKNLEDIRCEIINGVLVVESLLEGFDFLQKFSLPEDVLPSSLKTSLKNNVFDIRFLKKEERSESEENSKSI